MISIILESWQKLPPVSTAMTPLFPKEYLDQGYTDHATASWQQYGVRAGFGRLSRVLERNNCVGSVTVSAIVGERSPKLLADFVSAGNEVVAHGYSQDKRTYLLSAEEEVAEVNLCADILEEASGMRPVGWSSQGGQRGDNTPRHLLDAGYTYEGDFRDGDHPYVVERDGSRKLLAMPGGAVNDVPIFRNGHAPDIYFTQFRLALDQLRTEGRERPQMMGATAHSTHLGRPYGAEVLDQCLKYARQFSDVWICRRCDAAEHYLKATADL